LPELSRRIARRGAIVDAIEDLRSAPLARWSEPFATDDTVLAQSPSPGPALLGLSNATEPLGVGLATEENCHRSVTTECVTFQARSRQVHAILERENKPADPENP